MVAICHAMTIGVAICRAMLFFQLRILSHSSDGGRIVCDFGVEAVSIFYEHQCWISWETRIELNIKNYLEMLINKLFPTIHEPWESSLKNKCSLISIPKCFKNIFKEYPSYLQGNRRLLPTPLAITTIITSTPNRSWSSVRLEVDHVNKFNCKCIRLACLRAAHNIVVVEEGLGRHLKQTGSVQQNICTMGSKEHLYRNPWVRHPLPS